MRGMLDDIRFSGWAERDTALAHGLIEAMFLQSLPSGMAGGTSPPPPCHCLLFASASEYNRYALNPEPLNP